MEVVRSGRMERGGGWREEEDGERRRMGKGQERKRFSKKISAQSILQSTAR